MTEADYDRGENARGWIAFYCRVRCYGNNISDAMFEIVRSELRRSFDQDVVMIWVIPSVKSRYFA